MTENKHIQNRLKAPEKFFSWAKEQFPVYVWKNKQKEIRSSDRQNYSELIEKRLMTHSRLTFLGEVKYFLWIGATSKRIEFQMYEIFHIVYEGKERFDIRLYNFDKYFNGRRVAYHMKWDKAYYGLAGLRGCFGKAYEDFHAYQSMEEVADLLKKSELRYLDFDEFESLPSAYEYFDFHSQFAHIYKYRHLIEYAQKIRAVGILKDLVGVFGFKNTYTHSFIHADMRKLNWNFLRKNKAILKNSHLTFEDYHFRLKVIERFGVYVDKFNRYFPTIESLDHIPTSVKPRKFQSWVVENEVNWREYRDYKVLLEKLGIDFLRERIVMPSDFRSAHDEAVKNYNAIKDEIKNKGYQERVKELRKLETSIDGFIFLAPKKLSELKDEGDALNHCVGTYAKRVAQGETTIIFVRNTDQPTMPLYTLEIKDGEIIQLRGKGNKLAPENAQQAARLFVHHIRKQKVVI